MATRCGSLNDAFNVRKGLLVARSTHNKKKKQKERGGDLVALYYIYSCEIP